MAHPRLGWSVSPACASTLPDLLGPAPHCASAVCALPQLVREETERLPPAFLCQHHSRILVKFAKTFSSVSATLPASMRGDSTLSSSPSTRHSGTQELVEESEAWGGRGGGSSPSPLLHPSTFLLSSSPGGDSTGHTSSFHLAEDRVSS